MKNTRQITTIVAAILLLAGVVIVWLFRSLSPAPSEPTDLPLARSVEPATARPPAAQANSPRATGQAGQMQNAPDQGEETPEFVTEPVTEQAADEQAVTPSADTINAIRDIKKPVEGEGQVTEYPDGSAGVNLGNRYQSVPVATVGKDGKVHVEYHGEKYLHEEQKPEEQKSEVQKQGEKNP